MGLIVSFIAGLILWIWLDATEPNETTITTHYDPPKPVIRHEQVNVTYRETNKPSAGEKLGGESIQFEEVK